MPAGKLDDKAIFQVARSLIAGDDRQSYLQQVCQNDAQLQRVTAVLCGFEQAGDFLNAPASGLHQALPVPQSLDVPKQIGPYRIHEQIGEGGMGVVYLAQQSTPVRRRVALKVIKPGMDTTQVIARFGAERQALAMMNHPGIARMFDAGMTEAGRPYFVMELARGVRIDKYCDESKLPVKDRLKLFIEVCSALQHAHQKGIIHRDLKPSNILVTLHNDVPVVKVIDFGIAKALDHDLTERTLFTHASEMIGTPAYMSPEQMEGNGLDVDTRSDVYSLGVLLYKLLAGVTPFDKDTLNSASPDEMRRIIREEDPQRPSRRLSTLDNKKTSTISERRGTDTRQLSLSMQRELDWVVMKALEKDRLRRYDSVSALSADLQRYLDGDVVQACPPSVGYRLRKLARRNKAALITIVIVAASLLIGTGVSIWQAVEARTARDLADTRLELANERLQSEIRAKEEAADQRRRAASNLQRARSVVDRMLTRVAEQNLAYVPALEEMRLDLLQDALEFYDEFLNQNPTDLIVRGETGLAYARVGQVSRIRGEVEYPAQILTKAIRLLEEVADTLPSEPKYRAGLVACLEHLGETHHDKVEIPQKHQACSRALSLAETLAKDFPEHGEYQHLLARSHNNLGSSFLNVGQTNQALKCYQQGLAVVTHLVKDFPDVPNYQGESAHSHMGIGICLMRVAGQAGAAEKSLRYGISTVEKIGDASRHELSYRRALHQSQRHLGNLLLEMGRPVEANAFLLHAEENIRRYLADFPTSHGVRFQLVALLKRAGRASESQQVHHNAVAAFSNAITHSPNSSHHYLNRGSAYRGLEEYENALADYCYALELNPKSAVAFWLRGAIFRHRKEYEKAESDFTSAIELNRHLVYAFLERAGVYQHLQRYDEAIGDLTRVIELRPDYTYSYRGDLFRHLKQWDNAIADYDMALENNATHPSAGINRAKCYRELGKTQDALPILPKP